VIFATVVGTAVCGVLAFSFFSLDLQWLSFAFTAFSASAFSHSRIAAKSEMRSKVLKQALHRMISDDKIDKLAENPGLMTLEPQEQNVTIMFFDLVSFSLVSEGRNPKELFEELKIILNLICDCVYEYDGVVDKLLGDGALCLFGMSLSGEKNTNHPVDAVECAMEIQRRMLARNLSLPEGHVTFPVRVGVHTAPAFMGDLGNGEKIEFTVIGAGVNFARRLEEACESYRIMISSATLAGLTFEKSIIKSYMIRRDIGIKHHDTLFEAYEVNAFTDRGAELGEAQKRHNSMLGKQRIDERFIFPVGRELRIKFPMGTGIINDFSATGVRIAVDFYVSNGVQTAMTFVCDSEDIKRELLEHHLLQVQVLVRWGKPLPDGSYSLGVQYVGMQKDVQDILIGILRRHNEQSSHAQIRSVS
jgi:class 3 adenylate cyclase